MFVSPTLSNVPTCVNAFWKTVKGIALTQEFCARRRYKLANATVGEQPFFQTSYAAGGPARVPLYDERGDRAWKNNFYNYNRSGLFTSEVAEVYKTSYTHPGASLSKLASKTQQVPQLTGVAGRIQGRTETPQQIQATGRATEARLVLLPSRSNQTLLPPTRLASAVQPVLEVLNVRVSASTNESTEACVDQ